MQTTGDGHAFTAPAVAGDLAAAACDGSMDARRFRAHRLRTVLAHAHADVSKSQFTDNSTRTRLDKRFISLHTDTIHYIPLTTFPDVGRYIMRGSTL